MVVNSKEVSGKVVVVGDGACGKTCMLEVFKKNEFPEDYVPTVVDNYVKKVAFDEDKDISLAIWDTAGQDDYDTIRPLSYSEADLVIICYTVEHGAYLSNVSNKWVVEVKSQVPNAIYYLVALKKDLRDDYNKRLEADEVDNTEKNEADYISVEMGKEMAKQIKADKFFECSAKINENINEIFESVAKDIYEIKMKESTKGGSKGICGCCMP
ncbi:RHOB [Hepatospora eriocheir]|uniref:RHOB n=1 Tax=Hepatospora eriocheir TaxID=1081669 RepID=A0A1X0QHI2_9MICR|nr:RHOB [Hepatospora eriocheir]